MVSCGINVCGMMERTQEHSRVRVKVGVCTALCWGKAEWGKADEGNYTALRLYSFLGANEIGHDFWHD